MPPLRTLLLADDVRTTLAVEKAFLEARGFRVYATTSSTEALQLAAVIQPDLVILDYEMPEIRGDEACRRLKKDPRTSQVPVFILSAHDTDDIRNVCLSAGAVGFLKKTEGREFLLDQVAKALGLPHRRHARVPCRITVILNHEGEQFGGLAHNLSAGGLYLTLDRPVGKGAELRVRFKLPGSNSSVEVEAEVMRVETVGSTYACGVQFTDMDEEIRIALGDFVARTL